MTAEEKLKEIERMCKSWKLFRAICVDSESITVFEKAADEILKVIKENK